MYQISGYSSAFEFIFGLLVLFCIIFGAFIYKSKKKNQGNHLYYFFVRGLSLKLLGGFLFAIFYAFYYGYGDSFEYYTSSLAYLDFIGENPSEGFSIFLKSAKQLKEMNYEINSGNSIYILPGGRGMPFYYSPDFFLMSKILVPLLFLCFKTYFVTTLVVAFISFLGMWQFYLTICKMYPNAWKNFGYACFYVPSIFFWGSGMMKDSFTLCCFGFIISILYQIFFEKKGSILKWISLLILCYMLLILKGYILLAFLPTLFLWVFVTRSQRIKNAFFKIIVMPATFITVFIATAYGIVELSKSSDKYAIENLSTTARNYQSWHSDLAKQGGGGGSFYTLGDVDFTTSGIVSSIPAALNVTFFRPYLWEVRSFIMAISSMESLFMLCFTFFLIYKIKVVPFFGIVFKNPEILMFFLFTLILGFAVGFTSYNFGALARYKIPCLLTYLVVLVMINQKLIEAKAKAEAISLELSNKLS